MMASGLLEPWRVRSWMGNSTGVFREGAETICDKVRELVTPASAPAALTSEQATAPTPRAPNNPGPPTNGSAI
jgi:hypothetical protein